MTDGRARPPPHGGTRKLRQKDRLEGAERQLDRKFRRSKIAAMICKRPPAVSRRHSISISNTRYPARQVLTPDVAGLSVSQGACAYFTVLQALLTRIGGQAEGCNLRVEGLAHVRDLGRKKSTRDQPTMNARQLVAAIPMILVATSASAFGLFLTTTVADHRAMDRLRDLQILCRRWSPRCLSPKPTSCCWLGWVRWRGS